MCTPFVRHLRSIRPRCAIIRKSVACSNILTYFYKSTSTRF